jgi:hypothetical protein
MAEPVDLTVMGPSAREVPAVLTNLSAGGMALVVFAHVSGESKLKLGVGRSWLGRPRTARPRGLDDAQRRHHRRRGCVSSISKKRPLTALIEMAEDFQDCELKLSFGVKDVCFRKCHYFALCGKPVKLKSN